MSKKQEYVPFGKEWEREMEKFSKTRLIQFVREQGLEIQKMREALECVVEELENSRIHTNGRLHFCGMVRITYVREKAKDALAARTRGEQNPGGEE